jgi:hypothetical protein
LVVRWRDLASEHGASRPGWIGRHRHRCPASGAPGRGTGTGGGMLLAARAIPIACRWHRRDSRQPLGLRTRRPRVGHPGPVIGPGTAAARRGKAGDGDVRPSAAAAAGRRTASARRPQFLAGRPCHARTDVCATGRPVPTHGRPILPKVERCTGALLCKRQHVYL